MNLNELWCWLLPLLTGIISGIIGYYWGKSNSTVTNDCDEYINKNKALQSEIDRLKSQLQSKEAEFSGLQSRISSAEADANRYKLAADQAAADAASAKASLESQAADVGGLASGFAAGAASTSDSDGSDHDPDLNFDADAAKAAMGKKIKPDDLTIVEGIGPKISELFHADGIKTWYRLSKTDPARLKEILDAGGPRFTVHHPGSWPKQAGMAFRGEWSALATWQDVHKGGKE